MHIPIMDFSVENIMSQAGRLLWCCTIRTVCIHLQEMQHCMAIFLTAKYKHLYKAVRAVL